MNEIDKYMCIEEAAERWKVSVSTIRNKLKESKTPLEDLIAWRNNGLIKCYTKKGGTNRVWILSTDFMIMQFGEEKKK